MVDDCSDKRVARVFVALIRGSSWSVLHHVVDCPGRANNGKKRESSST